MHQPKYPRSGRACLLVRRALFHSFSSLFFFVKPAPDAFFLVTMYSAPIYLVFLFLIPTLGLALPHPLRDEKLASGKTLSDRAFTLPIHRRRVPTRHSRRDGASGSVGLGDNTDLYACCSPGKLSLTCHIQIIYCSHQTW